TGNIFLYRITDMPTMVAVFMKMMGICLQNPAAYCLWYGAVLCVFTGDCNVLAENFVFALDIEKKMKNNAGVLTQGLILEKEIGVAKILLLFKIEYISKRLGKGARALLWPREEKEVEKFVDLWLKKKNKKTGVLLNFKGLRRLLGKRQRLLAYLAKKNRNKNKDT
ncbi:hypothetical protein ACJX0J_028546, partial [Zea mays]